MYENIVLINQAKEALGVKKDLAKVDDINISQYFRGFNIASFEGVDKHNSSKIIEQSEANYVNISLKNEDLAPYSTMVNDSFSLKIAGDILLQAKDNNADFLVVRGSSDVALFDSQQKNIEIYFHTILTT